MLLCSLLTLISLLHSFLLPPISCCRSTDRGSSQQHVPSLPHIPRRRPPVYFLTLLNMRSLLLLQLFFLLTIHRSGLRGADRPDRTESSAPVSRFGISRIFFPSAPSFRRNIIYTAVILREQTAMPPFRISSDGQPAGAYPSASVPSSQSSAFQA